MPGRVGPIFTNPRTHTIARLSPPKSALLSKARLAQVVFQFAEGSGQMIVESVPLCDLTRQADGEPQAILKIMNLGPHCQCLEISWFKPKKQPRKRFREPRL